MLKSWYNSMLIRDIKNGEWNWLVRLLTKIVLIDNKWNVNARDVKKCKEKGTNAAYKLTYPVDNSSRFAISALDQVYLNLLSFFNYNRSYISTLSLSLSL